MDYQARSSDLPDKKPLPALTPARYRPGLFSVDVASMSIKDANQQLEHPIFTLSKKPDTEVRLYNDGNGNRLEIIPSAFGRPTIWDKDLLIFAISHIMDRKNRGEKVSPRIRFHTFDVIEFCQRKAGGSAYARIDRALTRLAGALLKTNIRTNGIESTEGFHIIDRFNIKRQYDEPDGRLIYCEFTLSDWLFRAVQSEKELLTLHPDYFRLRQALARRLYEIARKHCGYKAEWLISLTKLREKCGSQSRFREFRWRIRRLAEEGDLLDYDIELQLDSRGQEQVVFRRREGSYLEQHPSGGRPLSEIELPESVATEARRRHGENIDLATAERDWRHWVGQKGIRPTNPAAMFLSFLETWADRREDAAAADSADGDKPSWIQEMAEEWWETLDEDGRGHWRDRIGRRVELSDGEGWFRSEESMARAAFDARWRRQSRPPERMELPPQLLARAEAKAGGKAAAGRIEQGWRKWIAAQPDWRREIWMLSVLEFAGKCR